MSREPACRSVVLTALTLLGCRHTNPAVTTDVAPPADERRPELVSPLGRSLYAEPVGGDHAALKANLARSRAELAAAPNNPERIVWVARRLGYLWRMNEAVEVLTDGIHRFPDYAPFYRHRGHRYISLRRFDDAIADLEKATELIDGEPDEIEQDGAPNARNVPLTTLGFNVWYHLGVARYLHGDYRGARAAFEETMRYTRGLDDNVVAVSDWLYMTLCRLGRTQEADALLDEIRPDMEIIENTAYHRRLLMYKGLLSPHELLDLDSASELDLATLGYGLGVWHERNGERGEARLVWQSVVKGPYWPAFGFIAAEAELARVRDRTSRITRP